jgi:hypothetical protein
MYYFELDKDTGLVFSSNSNKEQNKQKGGFSNEILLQDSYSSLINSFNNYQDDSTVMNLKEGGYVNNLLFPQGLSKTLSVISLFGLNTLVKSNSSKNSNS